MIPIHDEIKARRVPYVNYILIVINVVVFIFEFMSGPRLEALITEYALVPAQLTAGLDLGDMRSILTSMFLHASWMHLGLNMLTVLLFGSGLESEIGGRQFWQVFLWGGVLGGLGWLAVTAVLPMLPPLSALTQWMPSALRAWIGTADAAGRSLDTALCIGASGGVFALIGAYAALFPQREVYVLVLVFPVRMKARTLAWLLGVVTVIEAVLVQSQVAYAAHLAGGLSGYLCGRRIRGGGR